MPRLGIALAAVGAGQVRGGEWASWQVVGLPWSWLASLVLFGPMTLGLDDLPVDVAVSPSSDCCPSVQFLRVQEVSSLPLFILPSTPPDRSCPLFPDEDHQSVPWVRIQIDFQAQPLFLRRSGLPWTWARTYFPWPQGIQIPLPSYLRSCAPKIRIGGSGAYASSQAIQGFWVEGFIARYPEDRESGFDLGKILLPACTMAEGLFRSLWAWMCLLVCRLLCHRMIRGASHPGEP